MIPILFFNFSLKITMWVFSFLLFEPPLAWMWRTRRYLADATAIQLTRNPDGLAQALQRLAEMGTSVPAGRERSITRRASRCTESAHSAYAESNEIPNALAEFVFSR